eukprot:TRINITY_DN3720_c0_g1_i2.p1 TRINITY_DN3720_c0_g1~~TRINITY_DN3720_c0_g1_i2.p1  ORF type:complete len:199 (-),score=25.45 TRINITY_DN3720_c0_g1_i2:715-1311(-)
MSKRFLDDGNGHISGIETVRVQWKKDPSGKPAMEVIEGSEQVFPADLVLLSMGFVGPESDPICKSLGVKLDPQGNFAARQNCYETNVKGVFAAGGELTQTIARKHLLFSIFLAPSIPFLLSFFLCLFFFSLSSLNSSHETQDTIIQHKTQQHIVSYRIISVLLVVTVTDRRCHYLFFSLFSLPFRLSPWPIARCVGHS